MAAIAVFNQKGGVGKTTTCLNLTAVLNVAQRFPIALVLDPQGHLTLPSGAKKTGTDASLSAFFKHTPPLANLLQETSSVASGDLRA